MEINMEAFEKGLPIIKDNWQIITKEKLEVELINGVIYAYCSELASLRLLKEFRKVKTADCGYSANLETYYFSLNIK